MGRAFCILLALVVSALGWPEAAQAQKRVALVVGNSAYTHTPALGNPRNDAADVAAELARFGFEVVEGYDLDNQNRRETVTMPDGRKQIVLVPDQPLPIFRKRQIVSSATVKDGHTLVLAGGSSQFYANPTRNQRLQPGTKPPTNSAPTHLLIFVTPTLIDAAGNRINPPE